jgi:class 3 adenylate cyclase
VTEDVRVDAGNASFRGFLFSDVRGFTAFAERHGNAAAAAMVGRFLELARSCIARHEGAEIKTEGDAIHAVFPSASMAVMCGLDILDAAAELNARETDQPLNLGVGVQAGEAVETAEGYIGTAVNLASRLCAAARPGELLVSSTVKEITQGSIPVDFTARGRRRLKGISEPVEIFTVTREGVRALPRGLPADRSNPFALAAAMVTLVVVSASIAIGSTLALRGGGASQSPDAVVASKAPIAQPVAMGPLAIGQYSPQQFRPSLTFDIADTGWAANRDVPALFSLIRDGEPAGNMTVMHEPQVVQSPCVAGGEDIGTPTADVIAQLEGLGHIKVENPEALVIGGVPAQQVDVTIDQGALAACGGLAGADVPVFVVGDEVWGAAPGERFRLITLNVGGEPVTVALSLEGSEVHSVQEMEQFIGLGRRILDSVVFEGAPAA